MCSSPAWNGPVRSVTLVVVVCMSPLVGVCQTDPGNANGSESANGQSSPTVGSPFFLKRGLDVLEEREAALEKRETVLQLLDRQIAGELDTIKRLRTSLDMLGGAEGEIKRLRDSVGVTRNAQKKEAAMQLEIEKLRELVDMFDRTASASPDEFSGDEPDVESPREGSRPESDVNGAASDAESPAGISTPLPEGEGPHPGPPSRSDPIVTTELSVRQVEMVELHVEIQHITDRLVSFSNAVNEIGQKIADVNEKLEALVAGRTSDANSDAIATYPYSPSNYLRGNGYAESIGFPNQRRTDSRYRLEDGGDSNGPSATEPDSPSENHNTLLRDVIKAQKDTESLQRKLDEAERRAQAVQESITAKRTKTSEDLKNCRTDIRQRELAIRQAYVKMMTPKSINPYLVAAIVLMIFVMGLLYYSLSWFRPEFAAKLIRKRVLIELLSMGFLLLTVIILGTSRMLDGAALAALLGTIAGYIFGRKTKKNRPQGDEAAIEQPANEAED